MKLMRLHPFSLCVGCVFTTIAFFAMGQKPASTNSTFEYKLLIDVNENDIRRLASEGWEFAGYLGQSTRGLGTDETLWKHSVK